MADQPTIPDETKAEILLESGFRCAVDGKPCSLETAQILPWHKAKEYKAEDLICLCKGCHEQAINKDKWDEGVLKGFKQKPWIVRQPEDPQIMTEPTTKVRLTIEVQKENFNENKQKWLQYAIAAFLNILPNTVRINKVRKGSVKIPIDLPKKKAEMLLRAHKRHDPKLAEYLAPLVLSDLYQVLTVVNASQAVGRRIANIWRWIIKNSFGFYGRLWLKLIILAIFIGAAILSAHSAIINCEMPLSARSVMAIAELFILFLLTDTLRFLFDLLYSSPREPLLLVRRIDPEIKRALNDVEEHIKNLKGEEQKKEIRFQARDICSDFLSRPPYPRITFLFACHAILNFLLTIFCFAVLTIGLARMDVYFGASIPTYGHDCFKNSTFCETLVHSFYYHSVIFQSLGDGSHSPGTIWAQVVAIAETLTSFFYIFLIFGGIYNASATARDNLTPRLIRTSIEKYLIALCSNDNPVIKSQDL